VPNDDPLYVGPLGRAGSPEAAQACRRADLLLVVGSRLGQFTSFYDERYIQPGTAIVQVDVDSRTSAASIRSRWGSRPTRVRRSRRRALQEELAGLQSLRPVTAGDLQLLQRDVEIRLSDWRGLLSRQVAQSRQILKKLLAGRIVFRQREDGDYEFSGQASLGRVLAGMLCTKAGVAPTGFEPVVGVRKCPSDRGVSARRADAPNVRDSAGGPASQAGGADTGCTHSSGALLCRWVSRAPALTCSRASR
jgi:Thiamine pyrophosphate enzyme, central domain